MKLYLAGPMTGYVDFNFPAFHAEAARLRALGHEVVSPAEINSDVSATWVDCMKADIPHLLQCDGIALMEGWAKSRGARLECDIAAALELQVVLAHEVVEQAA